MCFPCRSKKSQCLLRFFICPPSNFTAMNPHRVASFAWWQFHKSKVICLWKQYKKVGAKNTRWIILLKQSWDHYSFRHQCFCRIIWQRERLGRLGIWSTMVWFCPRIRTATKYLFWTRKCKIRSHVARAFFVRDFALFVWSPFPHTQTKQERDPFNDLRRET